MDKLECASLIWKSTCFLCFLYYVTEISLSYFAYTTLTNVLFKELADFTFPVIGVSYIGIGHSSPTIFTSLRDPFDLKIVNYTIFNTSNTTIGNKSLTLNCLKIFASVNSIMLDTTSWGKHAIEISLRGEDSTFPPCPLTQYPTHDKGVWGVPFSRKSISRLGPPYTDCRNYINNYTSQVCMDRCLIKYTIETCSRICPMPCKEEVYFNWIRGNRAYSRATSYLLYHSEDFLLLDMEAEMDIVMYLLYVCGLAGAWLGFAPLFNLFEYWEYLLVILTVGNRWYRRIFRYLLLCSCVAGCVWQNTELTISYFSYATVTSLVVRNPIHVVMPDVTLCYLLSDIIKPSKRYDPKHSYGYDELQVVTLSVNEILINDSTDPDQLIAQFRHERTTTFYSKKFKCFKLVYTEQTVIRKNKIATFDAAVRMSIKLHRNLPYSLGVQSRYNYEDPESGLGTQYKYIRSGLFGVITDYEYITKHALPYPFSTNCYLYSTLRTRHHCLETCVRKHGFVLVLLNASRSVVVGGIQEKNFSIVRNNCEQKCKKVCQSTSFLLRNLLLTTAYTYQVAVNNAILETMLILYPLTTLSDYIIFVSSCAGFWLSFSCATVQDFFLKFLICSLTHGKKLLNRRLWCLIHLTLMIFLVMHLEIVIRKHLETKTLTQTSISKQRTPHPTFSVCFYVQEVLNDTKFNYFHESAYDLNQITLNFSDIFNTIKFSKQDLLYKITPYFYFTNQQDAKCFRVFFPASHLNIHHDNIAYLSLKNSTTKHVSLMFLTITYDYMRPSGLLVFNTYFAKHVRSIATRVYSLPNPFDTNCRDYFTMHSRESCIEQCITRRHNIRTGKRYEGIYLASDRSVGTFEYKESIESNKLCREECSQTECYYQFETLYWARETESDESGIYVYPTYVSIVTEFRPRQSFTQFVLLL